jgi:hypothetical protein
MTVGLLGIGVENEGVKEGWGGVGEGAMIIVRSSYDHKVSGSP